MSRISRISIGFIVCCSLYSLGSSLRAQPILNGQAAKLKVQIDNLTSQLVVLQDENKMLQAELAKSEAEEQASFVVYRLQHVDVSIAGGIIQGLLANDAIRIAIDKHANSLIIKTAADMHKTIALLLQEIDRPLAVKSP